MTGVCRTSWQCRGVWARFWIVVVTESDVVVEWGVW